MRLKKWTLNHSNSATNSDKDYIVTVEKNSNGEYEVVAYWGRAGHSLQSQRKALVATRFSAFYHAQAIVDQKVRHNKTPYNVISEEDYPEGTKEYTLAFKP